MAATPQTDETVTERTATINQPALERRSWNYGYIGEDVQGRHHHFDRKTERVIVTNDRADRDDSGAVPVFSLEGPFLHAKAVGDHDDADDATDGVRVWIDFVTEEIGWAHRPISAADQAADTFKEVL